MATATVMVEQISSTASRGNVRGHDRSPRGKGSGIQKLSLIRRRAPIQVDRVHLLSFIPCLNKSKKERTKTSAKSRINLKNNRLAIYLFIINTA